MEHKPEVQLQNFLMSVLVGTSVMCDVLVLVAAMVWEVVEVRATGLLPVSLNISRSGPKVQQRQSRITSRLQSRVEGPGNRHQGFWELPELRARPS